VPGFEAWVVTSKVAPFRSAELTFAEGKTNSVQLDLFSSESPDAVRLVDALQSALYGTTTAPSEADATSTARAMLMQHGEKFDDALLATVAEFQLGVWKSTNSRFGAAQIIATTINNSKGELRTLSIVVGGRTFQIRLANVPVGDGRPSVELSDVRQ
jgi:hypothetical protein